MTTNSRILVFLTPLVLALLVATAAPTLASFHLMQIEQVIGGVGGDPTAQAIQLRMRSLGQNSVSFTRLVAADAAGLNPIDVIDMATDVPNGAAGSRVLITSSGFNSRTTPPAVADFTMTNLIPGSYLPAGTLTFEDDFGTIYWRLSWGGSGYTGPNTGAITNDPDGNFGPPWPGPLPSLDSRALLFQGPASAGSTNNAADYALTSGAAVFVNNAGLSFNVNATASVDAAGSAVPILSEAMAAPNPFRGATRLEYVLGRASLAQLLITDVQGREVAVMEELAPAGRNSFIWSGMDAGGNPVASGHYFYRLEADGASRSGGFVLLR